MRYLLLFSVFVIATCGLIYELVAGTLASYLLGDSVTQFSTVIGVYLFSMGVGAFFSKFIQRNLPTVFVRVELLIALVGGFSAATLFLVFNQVASFRFVLYGQVFLTGTLVGLEIPLLMRILQGDLSFKDLVSNIFTFDYIGALAASLLFPLLLVPQLGLIRTALFFGLLNAIVALASIITFRKELRMYPAHLAGAGLVIAALVAGFVVSDRFMSFSESNTYPGNVIYSESTPYQRLVLTRERNDLRLFLNGNLQFSSRDEYRYHEALVHPGLASVRDPKRVLILGGGDGLAAREILRYPQVDSILLVDLDPAMTRLFRSHPMLVGLNTSSLHNPKLRVINADAFQWAREQTRQFDFIVADFPDPGNFSLGKLYSITFFTEMRRLLAPGGRMVVQSTSPYYAPKSYWCIVHTLQESGFTTQPYHTYVPSFGEWGYILASEKPMAFAQQYPPGLKFITPPTVEEMTHFPMDMAQRPTEVNRLNNQVLVNYFIAEWSAYDL
jgi:spermidine synthase